MVQKKYCSAPITNYCCLGLNERSAANGIVICRGVDPYGTGGTRPPNIWTGGT